MQLNNDQLARYAPSIFAERPSNKVSDRYTFIPTIQVVDVLRSQGWMPTKAMQSRSRSNNGALVSKHLIRFRKDDDQLKVGDSFAELVLLNSHNGSTAFQLLGGVFRIACSNGMIVGDKYASHSVRHTGYTNDKIIEAQYHVLETVPKVAASVERMNSISLNSNEQLALAESSLNLKYETNEETGEIEAPIQADSLLLKRRHDDRTPNLWNTFNTIQENLLRGGLRGVSTSQDQLTGRISRRRTRTREVKSVSENVRLNKALWTLAESMATLKNA